MNETSAYLKETSNIPEKLSLRKKAGWIALVEDFLNSGMAAAIVDHEKMGKTAKVAYNGIIMAVNRNYRDRGVRALWRGGTVYLINERKAKK